jgi:hypothetical protein
VGHSGSRASYAHHLAGAVEVRSRPALRRVPATSRPADPAHHHDLPAARPDPAEGLAPMTLVASSSGRDGYTPARAGPTRSRNDPGSSLAVSRRHPPAMTDHDPSTGTAALTLAGLPRARRDQALLHLGQSWPSGQRTTSPASPLSSTPTSPIAHHGAYVAAASAGGVQWPARGLGRATVRRDTPHG